MKNTLIILIVIVLVGLAGGAYFYVQNHPAVTTVTESIATSTAPVATTTPPFASKTSIGKSVGGRDLTAYQFGTGDTEILFVGGIHGGYEWNTALVGYDMVDYLTQNPSVVPKNEKITVIPVLNPDGLYKTVGTTSRFTLANVPKSQPDTVPGRFNGNNVDLNRNFDCDWQAKGTWQSQTVSGGAKAFSEPESQAIKAYVTAHKLAAVVQWYSSAGGIYASNCHGGVSTETQNITKIYSDASGYPAHEDFNFYQITGDMMNWLSKINVPAISVLLTNHTDVEWDKNQKGIDAILKHYAK